MSRLIKAICTVVLATILILQVWLYLTRTFNSAPHLPAKPKQSAQIPTREIVIRHKGTDLKVQVPSTLKTDEKIGQWIRDNRASLLEKLEKEKKQIKR